MPASLDPLIERLWQIKGDRSFRQMAAEADLVDVTLWRVMHRQRTPSAATLLKLLAAYPELADLLFVEESTKR